MAIQPIIGRIPGYNEKIDLGGEFEQELKKGVTYIDLFPTEYTDAIGLSNDLRSGNIDTSKFFGEYLDQIFKNPGLVMTDPPGKNSSQDTNNGDPSAKRFQGILNRMVSSFGIDPSFAEAKSLRIVAANDSTFTETFTNAYDSENIITSGYNSLKSGVSKIPFMSQFIKGTTGLDSAAMRDLVGGSYSELNQALGSGGAGLSDLLSGAAFGMNIAAPQIWSASQYNSTLTLFLKLVSPTGQSHCIQKNILEPLLYLIAAASPVTSYGTVYGYPLMWQVHAHGITNFRIGSIAALSIIRGSFETTFTKALQPTVIDVRLTIVPLLSDFAVQTDATGAASIYDDAQVKYLGVQNPADVRRGTMNTGPMGGRSKGDINIVSVKI